MSDRAGGKISLLDETGLLLRLAMPMMLTQIAQMGMGVADTMMAGRVSSADLAGVALGGNFYWPSVLLLSGVIMSLTPSVSQLHGGGRESEAGEVVRQAFWIALVGGLSLILLFNNVEPLYHLIGVDPRAIPIAVDYLQALSWGVLPMLGYFTLRYLCEGLSWTFPAMLIALSALLLKIPLNYLFIYGNEGLGIPAFGGQGCGWSSAVVMTYQLSMMLLVIVYSRIGAIGVFSRFSPPDRTAILRLVRLGLPIGLTMFLEMSMFSVVTLLIGRLGVEGVAAHQIAGNVGGMTFMVPLALGMAVSIRVGFNVGAGDLAAARRSGWLAIGLSLGFAVLAAAVVFSTRVFIVGLYSTEFAVVTLAMDLLLFVVLYQFFDDAQVTALGALRGFKDTRTPMWVAIISYWLVGLPVGVLVGFGWVGPEEFEGVRGFWVGLLAGLIVAAVVLLVRYRWLSVQRHRILEFSAR
ncbi:MAG: MATE family efflux transporter [Pseudomonadales bacterium]|nr:MATE family efflux transporter [Pseudomonadales bacterium]